MRPGEAAPAQDSPTPPPPAAEPAPSDEALLAEAVRIVRPTQRLRPQRAEPEREAPFIAAVYRHLARRGTQPDGDLTARRRAELAELQNISESVLW